MTSDNSFTPQINYELLVETALRDVVRSALKIAEQSGLPDEAHFYITFLTEYPGINIPDRLKESHPEKMTIIIQHQYWDLKIEDDQFGISLSFGGQRENLVIPFMAVIDFNDPSVGFGLQFAVDDIDEDTIIDESGTIPGDNGLGVDASLNNEPFASADVVSLDTFRKKT